jgi:hypothetical protein
VQHALKQPSSAFVDLGAPQTGQAYNFLEDESTQFPVKSLFKIIIIWSIAMSVLSKLSQAVTLLTCVWQVPD